MRKTILRLLENHLRLQRLGARVAVGCLVAAVLAGAGCAESASRRDAQRRAATLIPPTVPPFLNGAVAILLTTTPGFSGHLTMNSPGASSTEPLTGELYGHTNKLFFAPAPAAYGGRPGGFGFLYDVDQARGFMLCDVMQGYAPVSARFSPTNVILRPLGGEIERVAGHPCDRVEVTFYLADAPPQVLKVWRARDLNKFPVRIASTEGRPFEVTLSRLRFEVPPADMFLPPEGFARYESSEGMMAEMVMRQEKLKRKPGEDVLSPLTPQGPPTGGPGR